jgi:signal transduction histidine kinase
LVVLSNAIKNSGWGRRIWVRVSDDAVAVEDEGAGISEEELPYVFDLFYQGEESSGGFGLGLPICKDLVERMGGEISIDSQKGVGTTVEIELPEAETDA